VKIQKFEKYVKIGQRTAFWLHFRGFLWLY